MTVVTPTASVSEITREIRETAIPFAESRSSYRFDGTITVTVTAKEGDAPTVAISLDYTDKYPDMLTLTSRVMFEAILGIYLKQ